ncbi:uncharacterized protein PFL1_02065 [Pseudozyma flocculosa PF-1]|uniref:Related to ATO2 - putative transmembrane protein involved in export of ammonia n=1 Tax=Pseudozyma flocculosa TaxID=84751 RepID=A0A5C3F2Y3_9BASI|nr:uncharacterized protein PFL1_02065 [Pseudozyma flocculosa PF-1]EPQ30540.1 hypothetical protein PFL1_02065 [Pseudozyma flocculosa PF-1]SPO37631.1 related to ATO2 - putative transmembrane protein involved in export of ammonia [Pseudozyma flocculosa]
MSSGYAMTEPNTAAANGNHTAVGTEVNGNNSGSLHNEKHAANGNGTIAHQAPQYHAQGYSLKRQLTAGGHLADDDLIAIGNAHRRIANPLPLGVFGFSTTTLLLSLYNVEAAGVQVPNAILSYALVFGGGAQYLAGLWEFACGNTFGATVFCSFGLFWWGFSMILIPFFGITGTYNGRPGVYATGSPFAGEEADAIGLYLWIWFGITTVYLIASLRGSVALFALIFALWITFILLGLHYYLDNHTLKIAGGAWGIITAAFGFYLGTASMLTKNNSYFTLPVISLAPKSQR